MGYEQFSFSIFGWCSIWVICKRIFTHKGLVKVKDLQKNSIEYVSANAQAKILDELSNNILTEEEIDIAKRGRNAHSHSSKTTDIITYKKATGLETLIGYLYINDRNRLDIIMKEILKWKYMGKMCLMN